MKKDYIPVDPAAGDIDDLSFVEEHWSRVWANGGKEVPIECTDEFNYLDSELKLLGPNPRILDAGCGRGEWTVRLREMGYTARGLDISRTVISGLQEHYPRAWFIRGDIRHTEFQDESFDLIFSWGAVEHFEDGPAASFRECRRLLTPGGVLLVSVPFQNTRHLLRDRRDLDQWDEFYNRNEGYTSTMRFYQWRFTRGELRREFELSGLSVRFIEAIHKGEGVSRLLRHDLHIPPASLLHRPIKMLLYPLIPSRFVGHMLIGSAIKR